MTIDVEQAAIHVINQRIFETSLDLILVADSRGTLIRVSPSSMAILGYDPDEMVGRSAAEFLYSEDLKSTRDEMRAARYGQITRNFECRYIHKQGRIVTLWWTGVWSPPERQYFFIGRDITERKEIERRIQESEARLALAVEIAEIGLASSDAGDALALVNTQFNSIYGRSQENTGARFGDWVRQLHAEDRDRVADELRRAMSACELYRAEFRINRIDTAEERWVRVAVQARPDSSGGLGRVLAVNLDVTEQKRAIEVLRESEARLMAVMDNSVDGLITITENGRVTGFSRPAERIFGYKAEEVIGQNVKKLMPEPFHSAHDDYLTSYLRTGQAKIIGKGREVRGRRKDGSTFPMDLGVGEIPHRAGVREFVGSVRDITGRVSIEDQLRQAQKMEAIGNLTGGMAHDFNNLLGVIIGNLDLTEPLVANNHEVAELVHEAIDAALSGADLTRRLLAFARRQPLRPERVAPNELISNIVRLLRRTLGENIEIALDLAAGLWPVVADPTQLEAALTNLATNARDAMPNGGKLLIATTNRQLDTDYAAAHVEVQPGDYAAIEVTDTGIGMEREVSERIFEPFYTTKEPGKGTGLGLSMVFGFVKQSGGHISVYSEAGVGTTFRLYLRRVATESATEAEAQPIRAPHGAGETVLAVEDNPRLRRVVMRQLRELGYQPVEADGPVAALTALELGKIDLLFTDIVMPGPMDGIALARQVIERWPEVKVILTSGFPGRTLDDQLTSHGAVAVRLLSKPYRAEDLARALREALDG